MRQLKIFMLCIVWCAASAAQAQFYGDLKPSPSDRVETVEPGQGLVSKEPCFASIATPQCALVKAPGEPTTAPANKLSDALGGNAQPGEGGEATTSQVAAVAGSLASSFLQGDQRLACEAILCLAAPAAPAACMAAIARYFSIKFKNPAKTLAARAAFLNLCPMSNDATVGQLIASLTGGAGNCDAATLNIRLTTTRGSGENAESSISAAMPKECEAYYGDANVSAARPMYVGLPDGGGRWVKVEEYDEAQALHLAQQKLAQEAAAANDGRGDGP
jgi:hypothetical protein